PTPTWGSATASTDASDKDWPASKATPSSTPSCAKSPASKWDSPRGGSTTRFAPCRPCPSSFPPDLADDAERRPMDIHVDYARCEGLGLCEDVASSLFRLDYEGELVTLFDGERVPEGYEDDAMCAVRACPVSALRAQ